MTNSNLVPTQITDKNGKLTTVHRRAEAASPDRFKGLPAPTNQAFIPPKRESGSTVQESYADRRERIAAEYVKEDGPEEIAAKTKLAFETFEIMGNIMMTAVDERGSSEREDFAMRIGMLSERHDFAAIILAERFAAVHRTLTESTEVDSEWDEPLEIDFSGEDTSDWTSDFTNVHDHVQIIDLVMTLRDHQLIGPQETPEHGDPRFLAHLYMSATKKINYRRDEGDVLELIKIVDEFPEMTNVIAEHVDSGLHAEGFRALFAGELPKGVVSGAL